MPPESKPSKAQEPEATESPRPDTSGARDGRRQLQEISRRDIKPILEELRSMIRRSELSQRQVEEAAGFSRGYLSQLLAQNLDLKVWHLLAILDIFGESPGDFFRRVRPNRQPGGSSLASQDPLAGFVAGSAPPGDALVASIDRLYHVGVDSLAKLRRRLERMDHALDELESRGLIETAKDGQEQDQPEQDR